MDSGGSKDKSGEERGEMGKSVYSSFKVNPTQQGPKNALFVCLFASRNLVRKSQWGD